MSAPPDRDPCKACLPCYFAKKTCDFSGDPSRCRRCTDRGLGCVLRQRKSRSTTATTKDAARTPSKHPKVTAQDPVGHAIVVDKGGSSAIAAAFTEALLHIESPPTRSTTTTKDTARTHSKQRKVDSQDLAVDAIVVDADADAASKNYDGTKTIKSTKHESDGLLEVNAPCNSLAWRWTPPTPSITHYDLPDGGNRFVPPAKTYCHIFKSNKPSSKRTQACYAASIDLDLSYAPKARKKQHYKTKKKRQKIESIMKTIRPESIANIRRWTLQEIEHTTLVFDGGDEDCPPIKQPADVEWTAIRVRDAMYIPDSEPDFGLTLFKIDDVNPVFVRVPRSQSLSDTGIADPHKASILRDALVSAISNTRSTNIRGIKRHTFSPKPVANLGAQPCRGKRGVSANSYHKKLMHPTHWDAIVRHIVCCEKSMKHVLSRDIIRHIQGVHDCTDYQLMQSTTGEKLDSPTIFSAINIAVDPILRGHTDADMMYSIVSCYLKEDHVYKLQDRIIAYFCFPTHGVAVPLRPGDILIFNPLEPHCISSKCRLQDTVLGTSMYVKTAIVGLNDNSIDLLPKDVMLSKKYEELQQI